MVFHARHHQVQVGQHVLVPEQAEIQVVAVGQQGGIEVDPRQKNRDGVTGLHLRAAQVHGLVARAGHIGDQHVVGRCDELLQAGARQHFPQGKNDHPVIYHSLGGQLADGILGRPGGVHHLLQALGRGGIRLSQLDVHRRYLGLGGIVTLGAQGDGAQGHQRLAGLLVMLRQIVIQRAADDGQHHLVDGAPVAVTDCMDLVQGKGTHRGGAGFPFHRAVHAGAVGGKGYGGLAVAQFEPLQAHIREEAGGLRHALCLVYQRLRGIAAVGGVWRGTVPGPFRLV